MIICPSVKGSDVYQSSPTWVTRANEVVASHWRTKLPPPTPSLPFAVSLLKLAAGSPSDPQCCRRRGELLLLLHVQACAKGNGYPMGPHRPRYWSDRTSGFAQSGLARPGRAGRAHKVTWSTCQSNVGCIL